MVDVYELASRLFARDFEGISEGKAREEAQWALRAAEVFVEECGRHQMQVGRRKKTA